VLVEPPPATARPPEAAPMTHKVGLDNSQPLPSGSLIEVNVAPGRIRAEAAFLAAMMGHTADVVEQLADVDTAIDELGARRLGLTPGCFFRPYAPRRLP